MMNKPRHYIYPDIDSLVAAAVCELEKDIMRLFEQATHVNLCLSGGSTPIHLYRALVQANPDLDWGRVRFFWGDERCVPPGHEESNYGNAKSALLLPLGVPESNVFRIRGEEEPQVEANRYANILRQELPEIDGMPVFDWMFLGLGEDGHTLSIFPESIDLWDSPDLCLVTMHPGTGQERVSLSGGMVNAAKRVTFFVTGENKSEVLNKLIFKQGNYQDYPASRVKPEHGLLEWYLDQSAAKLFS